MTTTRISLNNHFIRKLKNRHEHSFIQEYHKKPTESQLVTIGLIELESYITNMEYTLKIEKNGKIVYKIKKK